MEKQLDLFQEKNSDPISRNKTATNEFNNPQEGFIGNLGEWSEFYTFLRLLADGNLMERYEDHDHKKIVRRVMVVSVIKEHPTPILYHVVPKNGSIHKGEDILVRESDGNGGFSPITSKVIPRIRIKLACQDLADIIKNYSTKNGEKESASFGLPENHSAMLLIRELGWSSIKAPSRVKADLKVTTSTSPNRTNCITMAYSIKSSLGSPATLFNANKSSNLEYAIVPIDPSVTKPFDKEMAEKINKINSGRKIKNRINALKEAGYTLQYVKMSSDTFSDNLRSSAQGQEIDKILQVMLAHYYYVDGAPKQVSKIQDFLPILLDKDPLEFKTKFKDRNKVTDVYKQILKRLLLDMALGMTSSTSFDSEKVRDQVSGGMLVVKMNNKGDPTVEMHSVLHHKQMEEYLFKQTSLETASTKRHGFASAYFDEVANEWKMSLSLQIRFIREKITKRQQHPNYKQRKLL